MKFISFRLAFGETLFLLELNGECFQRSYQIRATSNGGLTVRTRAVEGGGKNMEMSSIRFSRII